MVKFQLGLFFIPGLLSVMVFASQNSKKKGPQETAKVRIQKPKAGSKVGRKFTIVFNIDGMKVKPAGDVVPGTGHHHLILNGGPIPAGEVVPMNETNLHYGKGQVKAEVSVPADIKGKLKLTAQFADGAHKSYGKSLSHTITVDVQ
jgi:hypothetical protein